MYTVNVRYSPSLLAVGGLDQHGVVHQDKGAVNQARRFEIN